MKKIVGNAMTNREKIESLKEPIRKLYSVEGRNKSYIARLFDIDRSLLSKVIEREWHLEKSQKEHLTPSAQKFLNSNKELIASRIKNGTSLRGICRELECSMEILSKVIRNEPTLSKMLEEACEAKKSKSLERIEQAKEMSSFVYDPKDIEGEEWLPINGYPSYMVSNKGRVKSYSSRYRSYRLMTPIENVMSKRFYVALVGTDGKKHNLQVSRLVGFHFLEGFSDERNTINHKDGDVSNNASDNLEWVSQSENNRHSYQVLKRRNCTKNKSDFKKVVYKGKYEFKTVAALARFIGKSETQTRRYLETPHKHDLEIIK